MSKNYSQKELEGIWNKVRGATPGLYVPVVRTLQKERVGPHFALFRTYAEVSGDANGAEKYWRLLNELPLEPTVSTLAAINLILAGATDDRAVQAALNRVFLSKEYVDGLANLKEDGPRADIEIVFSRCNVLTNLKALFAVGSNESREKPDDLKPIGDISLLCNNYVGSAQLRDETKQPNDEVLLMELLPTWELDNPRDLAYALTRVFQMIAVFLREDDPQIRDIKKSIELDPSAIRYDGLEIEDYVAVIFGIFAHGISLEPEAIFRKPDEAIINSKTFLGKTNFPQDKFEQFLNTRSLTLGGFKDKVIAGKAWDENRFLATLESDQFAADTLAIKSYPFLKLDDDRYVILDIRYVSELLIYGLYWRIVDQLNDERADVFISLWGRLLELHLFTMFNHYYPEASQIFKKDVAYEGGQIDALLDFGPDIMVFEFKASLLTNQTKNSRNFQQFEEEVSRKFIENQKKKPKALRQLASAAASLRNGNVKTTMKPKRIYPILVGYEPVLESLFMNSYLHERFRPLVVKEENDVVVPPITVMSVNELERVLPAINAGTLTWVELLSDRFDGDRVKIFSVRQALYDICQRKGAEIQRNNFLLERFDVIHKDIVSRYQRGIE